MSAEWVHPGVYEVASGVYRIPLPLPNDHLRAVNVYVITGPAGPVLIDSGWAIPAARQQLVDGLGELGAELGDVRSFLVTHVHRDHYTQAVHWRRAHGSSIALGRGELPTLTQAIASQGSPVEPQTARLRRYGASEVLLAELAAAAPISGSDDWELPDEWLEDGAVVDVDGRKLDVVETPGHTRGHVVFHDGQGALLFAGDHVLPTITPSLGLESAPAPDALEGYNPLASYLTSLNLVRSRPDALLLPAHGQVSPSVHARVDELLEHHEARLDACLEVLGWGADTAADVAERLTWTKRGYAFTDLDPFNRYLAIGETGAHLDLLVTQQRATVTRHEEVNRYAVP